MTEQSPERAAADEIVAAAAEAAGPEDGEFGEKLALVEAGTLLGEIGEALAEAPDELAELRLVRVLRRAAVSRREELGGTVRYLADVAEPPWPAIRQALERTLDEPQPRGAGSSRDAALSVTARPPGRERNCARHGVKATANRAPTTAS